MKINQSRFLADLISPEALGKPTLRLTNPYMSGPDIRDVQQRLLNDGFSLPAYGVDGVYGPETASAVKAFQAANGITSSGVVDTETWMALYAVTGSTAGNGSGQTTGNGSGSNNLRPWLLIGGAALIGIVMAKIST